MSNKFSSVPLILAIFVAVGGYGVAAALFNNILDSWYLPAGCAVTLSLVSVVLLPRLFSRFTGSSNRWINAGVQMVVGTGVMLAALTSLNLVHVESRQPRTVEVEVVKTFQTTHYQNRRIRRNTYVKGAPYQMYHVVVRFPGGKEKEMTVPRARYNQLKRKRTIEVTLTKGMLGMEIIKGI